jgi:hypothetical protein
MPSVDVGVIQQFLHPPVGVLTRELELGLFAGDGSFTGVNGGLGFVGYFGVEWSFFTIPDKLGYQLGFELEYQLRMLQLVFVHRFLDAHSAVSEVHDAHTEGFVLWTEALPESVNYSILPGVEIIFNWLKVL